MRAAILLLVGACQTASGTASPPDPLDGWARFEVGTGCELYAPGSADRLPPPIAWEPCRAAPGVAARGCRQMVLDWQPDGALAERIAPDTFASRDAIGRVLLHTARFQADGTIRLVAEADGPVRIALREQRRDRCALGAARGDGDHYAFRVYDSGATGQLGSYGGAGIGGRLGQLVPTIFFESKDRVARSLFAGDPGFLELGGGGEMTLSPWDGSPPVALWSSERGGGLLQNQQFFHGDALFWAADSPSTDRQMVWTAAGGVAELMSFGDDRSRGAADLGTDGIDLVWLEGSGRTGDVYPDIAVVTSPFTIDPARVERRVVRTGLSPYPFGTAPFAVGCGHAARTMADGDRLGTAIVRLADGALWHLPDGGGNSWGWRSPLAITCDEIFVRVFDRPDPARPGHFTVARVRLDSLVSES